MIEWIKRILCNHPDTEISYHDKTMYDGSFTERNITRQGQKYFWICKKCGATRSGWVA